MIPVSTRHLPPLLAALVVAATLICATLQRTHDECSEGPHANRLAGVAGTERLERYRNSVFQWTSEEAGPGALSHALIRSRTAYALSSANSFVRPDVIVPSRSELRFESHEGVDLPIHFSYVRGATSSAFFAHLFLYGGRPVERILPHPVSSMWEQLVSGRRPATLLVAWGSGTEEEIRRLEAQAKHWIVETWQQFESRCRS